MTRRRPHRPTSSGIAALLALALVAGLLQPEPASGQGGPAFGSDDFDAAELGDAWTIGNPLEDSQAGVVGGGTGDARLQMSVPAGRNHEPWNVNRSLRVLRAAENTDFQAVVRFQSVPTQRFQMQGIMVQQDWDNWMRFDVHHDGSTLRAFAGTTVARASTRRLDEVTPMGATSYLRVTRTGNTWSLAASPDNVEWQEVGSFDHEIEVKEIGVFAGNGGDNPAFTAVADYFFEASAPIDPEDGTGGGGTLALDVTATGPGAVGRSPDKALYNEGEQVTLTPIAQAGALFEGWSGAAQGGDNPLVVTMTGDTSITASFAPDTTPPVVGGLTVAPSAGSAVISWTTDEAAIVSAQVGREAGNYDLGSYASRIPQTVHAITIPGLSPGIVYHFRVNSTNSAGLTGTSGDYTFMTAVAPSVAFDSDDFNRTTLEPKSWRVVDPLGAGTVELTGAETTDAHLRLGIPGGAPRDATGANNALRVMEPAADIDFMIEAKLEALPTAAGQAAGLLIEQDAGNWLRFDVRHDGRRLLAHAATTSNGVTTDKLDEAFEVADEDERPGRRADEDDEDEGESDEEEPAEPMAWLRVARTQDRWELRTSSDGATWVEVGTFDFATAVNAVGPFASTSGGAPGAFTSVVDYVFEGSDPIAPEDQPDSAVRRSLDIETGGEGQGEVQLTPAAEEYVAGMEVRLTAVPGPDSVFTGWGGDLTGADNPVEVVLEEDVSVEASFAADATPPVVEGVTVTPSANTAVVQWRTDEPATSSVALGTSGAFEFGAVGSPYRTRRHYVTLGGLEPGRTYTIAPSSVDAAGHTTTAPATTFTTSGGAPAINLWYGDRLVVGNQGRSQTWVNVNGNASDPDGVTTMTYSLNGGEERLLSVGPDRRRLQQPGDFNAEVPFDELNMGENQVRLVATDAGGSSSSATVVIEKVEGDAGLPYETDWASGAIHDQAQVVDGRWTTDGDTLRPVELGYDRVVAIGDTRWSDYEVTFPVSVEAIGPGSGTQLSGPALVGFGMNWQGHTAVEGEQPGYFWYPTGALAWYRWYSPVQKFELRGNMDQPITRQSEAFLTFGQTYMFKGRSETVDEGVQYSWKVWVEGAPEPSGWNMTITEDEGPATGSVALIAHHADVRFGNVLVEPIE